MTTRVRIREKDNGLKRAQQLSKQPRMAIRIGVLEADAARPHPTRPGRTVGDVAVWMEYGTNDGHVPARSWLFGWLDEEIDVIAQQLGADTFRVIFGGENEWLALSKRASVYRQQIEDRIRFADVFDRNEDATVRKKGFDLPLIDTETFIESIRWEVK